MPLALNELTYAHWDRAAEQLSEARLPSRTQASLSNIYRTRYWYMARCSDVAITPLGRYQYSIGLKNFPNEYLCYTSVKVILQLIKYIAHAFHESIVIKAEMRLRYVTALVLCAFMYKI